MMPVSLHPTAANILSVGIGLILGAVVAPVVYLAAADLWEARQIASLESGRILDTRWKVVERTESTVSIHAWGVRYRSPECKFTGIEAMAISPEGAMRPTEIWRPEGIGPIGTLPAGRYDAGTWVVSLPRGYAGASGIARYECRRGDVVVQTRALLFRVPPDVNDGATQE
jgi:hypothetical protein